MDDNNLNDERACVSEGPVRPMQVCADNGSKRMEEPKQEILKRHEINIKFFDRGCVIRVGCKEIPFESNERALLAIKDYFNDPARETKAWYAEFNKENE